MKIYLVNLPYMPRFARDMRWQDTGRGGTLYYPIWLAYATAILSEQYDTRLVDAPVWNWDIHRVKNDILEFEPALIVVSTSFPSLGYDISCIEELKKAYDGAKYVVVGPPTTQFQNKILQNKTIDYIIRGEYDFALQELACAIESGIGIENIKGLSFIHDGVVVENIDRDPSTSEDLDRIPFVSKIYKEHLNIHDYFLGYSLHPEVQIFASRGCPHQCTFCNWTQTFTGRRFRIRRPSNVIEELLWIQENLPEVKEVFFEDDTFTIDKTWVHEFCNTYIEKKVNIPWACQCRADLDYETIKIMKEARCRVLVVGFESGSDEILKNVKKGITIEDSKRFLANAKKAAMPIHGNYVIGLPGETKETIELTRQMIRDAKSEGITVAVTTPFPGTELYDWAKENNYMTTYNPEEYLDETGHQKSVISYPWLSNHEVTVIVDQILREYFISFRYVPIAIKRILQDNPWGEFKRLMFSATRFLKYLISRI